VPVAGARRGTVEKLALAVGGLAFAWLVLHAGLAQLARADDEVIAVPGELVLSLDEGDQRAVYLREGSNAAYGLTLGATMFRCSLSEVDLLSGDGEAVVPERIDETRTIDGWNPHVGFVQFTAPRDGEYLLSCRSATSSDLFSDQLTTGVELFVASPGAGWMGLVSPSNALVWCMVVLIPVGIVYVVAGALGRRD
jgi:hypothetical protein